MADTFNTLSPYQQYDTQLRVPGDAPVGVGSIIRSDHTGEIMTVTQAVLILYVERPDPERSTGSHDHFTVVDHVIDA